MAEQRAELQAFGFRALLEVAGELLGQEQVEQILDEQGVSMDHFRDPTAWFSAELAESLVAAIDARIPDPSWLPRAMRLAISPRYLGPLYPLLHAFGSPAIAYRMAVKNIRRFNRVTDWTLEEQRPGYTRLAVRLLPGTTPERTSFMCDSRLHQLAAIPLLFDLPPARVDHARCMARGDDVCVYEVHWREPRRPISPRLGLLLGLAISAALLASHALSWPLGLALSLVLVLGCWSFGRNRVLARDVSARVEDLTKHQDALMRLTRDHDERYAELLHAKSEVDQKVEQRTAELRAATQRLSETLQGIQALDRAKTDFFNNVSHELRSPLTLILAPLEELVSGRVPAGGERPAFLAMQRSAQRLLRLINQLLDLAKIDAGETKIAPVSTDLAALARATVASFEAAAQKKGVELQLSASASMPALYLDTTWIESALNNLLANALRLTPRGGGVRVGVEDRGSEVALVVADDGPGIAPEQQRQVFERFAQGDVAAKVIGGTGIGLALVREAARLHGGDVQLVSQLGAGATFTMLLPRRPAPQGSIQPIVAPPEAVLLDDYDVDRRISERPGPSPTAALALVVEDNRELRDFISNVLAVRYRVRGAGDGRTALALARELKPDIIVTDVAMPIMNGYDLCRALRRQTETRATPILLLTARTEVSSVIEGFEAGADDYLTKPFHGRELLARVDVHVRLRRVMQDFALRQRHAALGVLAASVAHQVRNPLTSLLSGLPAMQNRLAGHVNPSTLELMEVMIDCARRIERMTSDLMDLSRVDREVSGPYCPSDGLRAAIRLVRARLPGNVVIEERISDAPIVDGRPGDMNHVFLNLLDNAARAVGDTGRIHVEAQTSNGNYVVRVGDSGPGVDEATAERIFEPFFTTRRAGEGTGLGLAVAQQVVHQCGGQIELSRSELGGALFTVNIPTAVMSASLHAPARPTLH